MVLFCIELVKLLANLYFACYTQVIFFLKEVDRVEQQCEIVLLLLLALPLVILKIGV